MTDSKKKRKKGSETEKPITEVEDEEALERLFSKKVVKEVKKVAHDARPRDSQDS